MIVLARVRVHAEQASFVLRVSSLPALMVSLELAQSVLVKEERLCIHRGAALNVEVFETCAQQY